MTADLDVAGTRQSFFYHLGDVVYFTGDAAQYYPQFYEPYAHYDAPIVAIPGNHDGAVVSGGPPSLDAFLRNFCGSAGQVSPDAQDAVRTEMVQPYVYWVLESPLATIIGLYTNVPEGGVIGPDQAAWLSERIAAAPKDRALIIAAHHPLLSADTYHSASPTLRTVIESAYATGGRTPDLVLTGHVHNYQRFTRTLDGRDVTHIVAGGGGYHNLHRVLQETKGVPLTLPWTNPDGTGTLQAYDDEHFGYLRLTVTRQAISGEYVSIPRPDPAGAAYPGDVAAAAAAVTDRFTVALGTGAG